MITIEIRIHNKLKERVSVRRADCKTDGPVTVVKNSYVTSKGYWESTNLYLVNEVYRIKHNRADGHRELARKALEAIRRGA